MIVGMTGCGKTYYLLNMIEKDYFGHFDYIFLICPTYFWNKTYQNWTYKDSVKFYPLPCDQNSVDDFLKYMIDNFKGTNSLIILYDCAATQIVKNRVSELVKLTFSTRHYGLSTVVLTQKMTSIAKPYRENISKLVTFTIAVEKICRLSRTNFSTSQKKKSPTSYRNLKATSTQD